MNNLSETIAFLDVQVNHITKDVGHIINGAFKKRFKDTAFFINANSKEEKKVSPTPSWFFYTLKSKLLKTLNSKL